MSAALEVVRAGAASGALAKLGLRALTPDLVVEPRAWLVEGLWPEKAIGFLGGPPKAGKSWLALDLAIAVASGADFLGHHVNSPGPVLFLSGEEYFGDVAQRIDRLLAGSGLKRDDLHGRILLSDAPLSLESKADQHLLVEAVAEAGAAMVFIDPLARFLREADENAASQMRIVNNFLRQDLNRGCEVGVCVVHHTDKKNLGLRGTGDLRALSEVTLLMGEPGKKGARVALEMRGARPPDPFYVRLADGEAGAVAWQTEGLAVASDRAQRAKALLSAVGDEGITLDGASKELGVRRSGVREVLEAVGGAPEGPKGRWVLAGPERDEPTT